MATATPISGGAAAADGSTATNPKRWNRFGQRFDRYKGLEPLRGGGAPERTGGTWAAKYGKKIIAWDVAPGKDYFEQLFRVSRDQIIWGGNYFDLPPTRCFIVWDKCQGENFSMAAVEYAWTSFSGNAKKFTCPPMGRPGERFHPTQKPVKLYEWLLDRYARPGMRILDTHAGSAGSLVACHRAGLEAWGFEIDPAYYQRAAARLDAERAQLNLFADADLISGQQLDLFTDQP